MVVILLVNAMEVFSVSGGALPDIDRTWSSKECAWDPSVHPSVPSIGFVFA